MDSGRRSLVVIRVLPIKSCRGGTLGLSTQVNAPYRGIITLLGRFYQSELEACGSGSVFYE